MSDNANIAAVAALIAEPARALMLMALLDGRALSAGELAYACSVTPQTASSRLAKLVAGGLLTGERSRHGREQAPGGGRHHPCAGSAS